MMQSPLLGYSAFSHFLQQHGHGQQSPLMTSPGPRSPGSAPREPQGGPGPHLPGGPRGMPSFLATSLLQHLPLAGGIPTLTRCPSTSPGSRSSDTPSPSSSPPAPSGLTSPLVSASKSFTIDAILGLRTGAGGGHDGHARFLGGPMGHVDLVQGHHGIPRLPQGLQPFHLHGHAHAAAAHAHAHAHAPGGPGGDSGTSSPTDLSVSAGNRMPLTVPQPQSPRRTSSGSDCGGSGKKSGSGSSCGGGGGGKSKRVRTIFTAEQLERLEAEFERQQYMVGPERLYLAHALSLTEAQVKVWFQNRRIKWRKQHLEMQQQRLAVIKQQQHIENQQSGGPQQQQRQQLPLNPLQAQVMSTQQQQQHQLHHDMMDDSDVESMSGDEAPASAGTLPLMVGPGPGQGPGQGSQVASVMSTVNSGEVDAMCPREPSAVSTAPPAAPAHSHDVA